ncbi:MAG: hypothetical protein CR988_05730 [Treponema sp.]|nr:MAG: hypothetical protein CR988_05730 [Treponema sp.]
MISEPAQNSLKPAFEILNRGNLDAGYAEFERILQHDLENEYVVYCLKATSFWKDKFAKANNIANHFEAGEYLISQWKPFLVYLKKLGFVFNPVVDALKTAAFHKALNFYRQLYEDENGEKNAELYRKIGLCCKSLGDYETALNFAKKAAGLSDDSAPILAELADAYAFCGDIRFAKVYFREAFFKDASKIQRYFLESEFICRLIDVVEAEGYKDEELLEWVPVYGVLKNVFTVKRELKALEIGQLKQRIFWLENEMRQKEYEKQRILKPKLINSYFWLIDYYSGCSEEKMKIDEVLLKIKFLDKDVYDAYVG